MKQTNDFNCGPTAIAYFLKLHGYKPKTIESIEKSTRCEPKRGTKPQQILRYLSKYFKVRSSFDNKTFVFPSIVLYLYDRRDKQSGHYGVITSLKEDKLTMFDPWDGKVKKFNTNHFMSRWCCPWYGDRWMLSKQ